MQTTSQWKKQATLAKVAVYCFGFAPLVAGTTAAVIWRDLLADQGFANATLYLVFPVMVLGSIFFSVSSKLLRPSKRAALADAAESLDLILKTARAALPGERSQSLDPLMPIAGIQECRVLLGTFEAALDDAKASHGLKDREVKLDCALGRYQQYLIRIRMQEAERLDASAKSALTANDGAKARYDPAALQRIRDLAASVKRELDATNPDGRSFAVSADKALESVKQPLAEAARVANEIGLLSASQIAPIGGSDEALLVKTAKLLAKARRSRTD
jgi:hypothetical protein